MPVARHTELLEKHMRTLIALTFCFLLAVPQVQACRPYDYETIFFGTIPDPPPDADVIAKVSLSDVSGVWLVKTTATVIQVLKASDARVYPGAKIAMQVKVSSCGPFLKNGSEGTIIAKVAMDNEGHPVLCPYTYRERDEHFWPPIMSDEDADGPSAKSWRDGVGCPNGEYWRWPESQR